MRQVLNIFFKAEGTKPWLVLLGLLLAGMAEALGMTTLLPAAAAILDPTSAGTGIGATIRGVIERLGITPTVGSMLAIIVGLMLFRAILSFAAMVYAGMTAARVSINLRRRLIAALFNARWRFYSDQRSGRMANAISNDATRAGDAYNLAAALTANIFQLLAYAVVALLVDWRVALVGFFSGSLMALATGWLVRLSKRSSYKQTDRQSQLTGDMVDMITNIKALKSMNRYGFMIDGLSQQLHRLKRTLVTLQLAKHGVSYGNDALVAVLIAFGAWLMHVYWHKTLPEMVVMGIAFVQIVSSVSKFQKQLNTAIQMESAFIRTEQLIAGAEAEREVLTGTAAPHLGTGARFANVSFGHGDAPVVKNVSFAIPAGQITVLQGPSGAGKTTLIDLLIGLHLPQAGDIFIGTDAIQTVDLKAWRQRIGYVPQELVLFHDTIRTNITLGDPSLGDEAVRAALEQAGATDFIASLPHGLDTVVGEMGGKLSGGQRQRISLARALVKQPELLILDEVTSALDPEVEAAIVANISELRGRYTIIAITHRPAWTAIADQLYQVQAGHVRPVATQRTPRSASKRKPRP